MSCLKWRVESDLGHCDGGILHAVGSLALSRHRDHVFAFQGATVDARQERAVAVPRRGKGVVPAFELLSPDTAPGGTAGPPSNGDGVLGGAVAGHVEGAPRIVWEEGSGDTQLALEFKWLRWVRSRVRGFLGFSGLRRLKRRRRLAARFEIGQVQPQAGQVEWFVLRQESVVSWCGHLNVNGTAVHAGSRHGRNIPLYSMRRVATDQRNVETWSRSSHGGWWSVIVRLSDRGLMRISSRRSHTRMRWTLVGRMGSRVYVP